ncbi:MAG: hypothetical protein ACOYKE_10845, partial [Ferruginibacter sp.]
MRFNAFWAILVCFSLGIFFHHCTGDTQPVSANTASATYSIPDTTTIANDKFGESVKYGMRLMYNTAYYIGPNGINGKFLGNKMNCTQ